MRVRISEEAELDLADSYWFYEKQDDGLGSEFRDSVKADIRSLETSGGSHSKNTDTHERSAVDFHSRRVVGFVIFQKQ